MLHETSRGEPCALVSNIQKYTIHDGPGIRTTVFFTGCTLRCLWCSNPETIEPKPRPGVYPKKCLSREKCGLCVEGCPLSEPRPIEFDGSGFLRAVVMRPECDSCFKCAEICPPRAIKVWGEKMTLPELMKVIREDRSYYDKTGGGLTLNGGEVMQQWEFARTLLKSCRDESINTCVETALHCPREHMEAVFEFTDLVIADIKHMDPVKHKEYTGAGNELVLGNLKRAAEIGKKLVVRTPVIPGYNGDEENIRKTGAFIRDELGGAVVQYQLLPYRKMGTEKYDSLGLPYPMGDYIPPERAEWEPNLSRLADMLRCDYRLPAVAGSGEKLLQRRG